MLRRRYLKGLIPVKQGHPQRCAAAGCMFRPALQVPVMTLSWASDASQMPSARQGSLLTSGTIGCHRSGPAGLGLCVFLPCPLAGSRVVLQAGLQLPNDGGCSIVGALWAGRPVGLPPLRPLQPRYVAAVAHLVLRGQLPYHEFLQDARKQPRLQHSMCMTQTLDQLVKVGQACLQHGM